METAKGHMYQTSNKPKSTKPQDSKRQEEPPMKPLEKCTIMVFTNIIEPNRKIAMELTGKLSVTSNTGNK